MLNPAATGAAELRGAPPATLFAQSFCQPSNAVAATKTHEPAWLWGDARGPVSPLDVPQLRVQQAVPEWGQAVPVIHPHIPPPATVLCQPMLTPGPVGGLGVGRTAVAADQHPLICSYPLTVSFQRKLTVEGVRAEQMGSAKVAALEVVDAEMASPPCCTPLGPGPLRGLGFSSACIIGQDSGSLTPADPARHLGPHQDQRLFPTMWPRDCKRRVASPQPSPMLLAANTGAMAQLSPSLAAAAATAAAVDRAGRSPPTIAVATPRRLSRGGAASTASMAQRSSVLKTVRPAASGSSADGSPASSTSTTTSLPGADVVRAASCTTRRPRSASASLTTSNAGGGSGEDCHERDELIAAETNEPQLTVKFLEDSGYFDITLSAAAGQLGVGVTTLKKLCRVNGLPRWPYRARCSLRRLRDKMRGYFGGAPADERGAAEQLLEREFERLSRMNEGIIDEPVKLFRQAIFKLEFKARQQVEGAAERAGGRRRPATDEELQAVIQNDPAFRQQAMQHLRRLLDACSDDV